MSGPAEPGEERHGVVALDGPKGVGGETEVGQTLRHRACLREGIVGAEEQVQPRPLVLIL